VRADEVVAVLREKHYPAPAWAFLEQVGDRTGAYTRRHADAIAMSLYPSRGLVLHGIEVKVDRRDWLMELANPEKAEAVAARCDRWYVAAPEGVVDPLTLPDLWGLLVIKGGKTFTVKEAGKLEPKPLDHSFLAAILRAAAKASPTLEMREDARREAQAHEAEYVEQRVAHAVESRTRDHTELVARVAAFEEASGIVLQCPPGQGWSFPSGEKIGEAVAFLARGGVDNVLRYLGDAQRAAERINEAVAGARVQLS
jgi:hypothetical protein